MRAHFRWALLWESERSFGRGAVEHMVQGVPVQIYTPAKTVAHLFKVRRRLGTARAVRVLAAYRASESWDPEELAAYAAIDRVGRVRGPYLDALGAVGT